jgi:VanZ family protein
MHDFAPLLRRIFRWPAVLFWMLVIFGLSSIPNYEPNPTPSPIPADKVAHACIYAVLAFLLAGVLRRYARPRRIALWIVAVCVVSGALYGASDEYHQRYTPGRDPDVYDWVADVAGSVAGTFAIAWVLRRVDVG